MACGTIPKLQNDITNIYNEVIDYNVEPLMLF